MIKKIIKNIILLASLGILVWTFYYLYSKSKVEPNVYNTVSPFDTTIVKKTVAAGSVIPRKEINMKSQVSGIIEKLYIEAGESVKEGDVIAKIKIIPNMINLSNAENRVEQAQISFDNAKLDYDRNKTLFEQGIVPKADLQGFEQRFNSNKEELSAAQDNLEIIKEGVSKSAGKTSNTLVRATISGMVLDVPVKEGSQVIESNTFNEGTTIAAIANMGEMIFEGKLDESEVGKINSGMEIELTVGAIETEKFKAKLEYISPKGVAENGAIQFIIRASIDNFKGGAFLRAGYSANADIILQKRENVLAIPEGLIQFECGKSFVEVEKSKQVFEKIFIKTGLSDGINIEVLEGIKLTSKIKGSIVNMNLPN